MKTILTIGYQHFLLPATANLNAIVATLNKATPLTQEYRDSEYRYFPKTQESGRAAVSIELVPDHAVIDPKQVKRKALPEHASPDAHNTFGS